MSPLIEIRSSSEGERKAADWHQAGHYLITEEADKLTKIVEAMTTGQGIAALVYKGDNEGLNLWGEVWDEKRKLEREFRDELGKIIETKILDNQNEDGELTLLIREFPHNTTPPKP